MCLINCRSKEEPDVIVAPRPVSAPRPLSTHSSIPRPRSYISQTAPIPLQSSPRVPTIAQVSRRVSQMSHLSPRASQISYIVPVEPQPRLHPQGQVVVIDQRSPRTSGALSIRAGGGYVYGAGPVVPSRQASLSRPGIHVQGGHRRSGSLGVERRSSAVYGKDPRASNTSYRSTRERIVIVDGNGTRREYYR